jgi:hypothetical protein
MYHTGEPGRDGNSVSSPSEYLPNFCNVDSRPCSLPGSFSLGTGSVLTQTFTYRKISRIYALFKAYTGERVWKAIGDRKTILSEQGRSG